jgi:Flp pilus assembly protein TadD
MKLLITLSLLIFSLASFAQSKAEPYMKRALEKKRAYDYEAAALVLDSAIAAEPNNAEAHYLKGLCNAQLNDINAAEEEFKKTVNLDPKHAMAYYNMGYWKDVRKNKSGALDDMKKAWELASDNTDIGLEYVNLLYEFKKKDEACVVIAKLVENGSQLANEMQTQFCD